MELILWTGVVGIVVLLCLIVNKLGLIAEEIRNASKQR